MNVLLISSYELGHQPFNVASPAAHLLDAGFEVQCLDLAVQPFDDQLVEAADLVAFSTPMHTALRIARKAAHRVRTLNPDCHVGFYGLYAGMHADLLLSSESGQAYADSVIGGEFERPLVALAESIRSDRTESIRGVINAKSSGGTSTDRQQFLLPARHLLPPIERYARMTQGDRFYRTGYVEASRGCAHHCLHCPITPVYDGRMRIVQQEVVLADIEQLVGLGAEHITFGDPDFLNGVRHSQRIIREMHNRFPSLTFDFTAKIEHLLEYQELLPEFRACGCVFVVSAGEILNDTILQYLDKGHTRADVEEAVQIADAAGIALRPSLMPFTPWTTARDLWDVVEFVEAYQLYDHIDPVQFSIRLLLPPQSSLLSKSELQPFLSGFDTQQWIYRWRSKVPEMDAVQRRIADLAEQGVSDQDDNFITFLKIRQTVSELAEHFKSEATPEFDRKKWVPRLTEDWFC